MAKGITVTIPHNLGRAEASRRVRDGLDPVIALLAEKVHIEQSAWTNDGVSLSSAAQRKWKADELRESRLVFIGRELPEQAIRDGFERCIAT